MRTFAARYSIADIARESGIGEQMLRNKLNPDQPHQLTARDLVAIYQVTGDDILFDGLLFDCGLNAVRLPGQPRLRQRPAPSRHSTPAPRSWASLPTTILAGDRVTKSHRNTVVTGIWAGIEHLVLLATEVEDRFHAVHGLACAADMARAALGA